MTPKFTTPCFIRKNTPELRKKLEELGYIILFSARNGYGNGLCACGNSVSSSDTPLNVIDCGENEQLFLALAALREDNDHKQWNVYAEDAPMVPRIGHYIPKGAFHICMCDEFEPIANALYHKATPAELIEHFKEK